MATRPSSRIRTAIRRSSRIRNGDPTQQQDPYGYPQSQDPGYAPYGLAA